MTKRDETECQRTPTPWRLDGGYSHTTVPFKYSKIYADNPHFAVASIIEREEDAVYIVLAVNSHARLTKERDDLRRALEDIVAQFTDNDAAVLKQWEDAGTECLTDERWNQASSAKWYADFARTTLQALKGTE